MSTSISIGVLTIIIILFFYVFRYSYSTYKKFKLISSLDGFFPNPSILIGHSWTLITEILRQGLRGMEVESIFSKLAKEQPYNDLGYVALWIGNIFIGYPIIVVTRSEIAREILSKKKHVRKSFFYYYYLFDLLGNGLIASDEQVWTSRRKIFNPAFHAFELKHYIPIMTSHALKVIEKIESQTLQESNQICIHNMTQLLSEFVLATLLETLFDGHEGDIDPQYHSYVVRVDELLCERINSPWKFLHPLYRWTNEGTEYEQYKHKIHSVAEKCLKKRMELVKKNETKSHGIFDSLIRNHFDQPEVVTMQDMVDEVATFIFAGTDTTNWSIIFVLFMLGHHIEEQEHAFQEIIRATNFDRESTETRDINFDIEVLSKLKYLECIIKETQRIFPIVNTFVRHVVDDLSVDIDGYSTFIPGNTQYMIICEILHKNPRYWTDPSTFNPSRFLNIKGGNGDKTAYDSYSFVPFSSGPRNCIGKPYAMLEMKIILAYLVSAYKIRSITPLNSIRVNIQGIITRTRDPLSFTLEPRI